MKKLIKFLSILLVVFTVGACSCSKKITLSDEYYVNENEGGLVNIDYDKLSELINDKKSFVVFVFEATCSSCICGYRCWCDAVLQRKNAG